ncbi:MAG: DUF2271 domain-containing protein, partial [Moraxellaceae bacterium]
MRKASINIFLTAMLIIAISATPARKFYTYTFSYDNVLGTSLDIKLSATTQEAANAGEVKVLAEIDRQNTILSGYSDQSEFKRWAATADKPVQVSKELFEVLELFDTWTAATSGALTPAAETIGQVWKHAASTGSVPSANMLSTAVNRAGGKHWMLNREDQTATRLGNAPLALNTFVKGYIIDKAVDKALRSMDVNGIVLNIGGDIFVKGQQVEPISVSDPRSDAENASPLAILNITNKA